MMMRTALVATLLSLLAACSSKGPKRPSPEDMIGADPLPLALGASWQYTATISQFDAVKKTDVTRTLDWTTQVVEARPISNVVSFKVKGWPSDLVGFEGAGPSATEKTIIRAGDNFLWATSPDGGVEGAQGWFSWPLQDGQKICPDPQVVYCWLVETGDDGYKLTYRTGPDEEIYLIQPGTGVAEYTYIHHGTTLEVHAKLVDYKEGQKGALSTPTAAPAQ